MSKEQNSNRHKRNAALIIAAIVILLSITSCSAITHFGKIGKYARESTIEIDDTTGDKKINKNDKLTFDVEDNNKTTSIDIKDGDYKLSFSIKNISPKKYTCQTDDAKIATCIVEDGYVRIKPKKKGKVLVTLSTQLNNTKYIATTTIKVTGTSKSSKSGSDNVEVNVDDSKANQTKNNNSSSSKNTSKGSNSKNSNNNSTNSNNNSTNSGKNNNSNSSTGNNNTSTDNTNTNTDNGETTKSSDATLKTLSVNGYTLTPAFNSTTYEYTVEVGSDTTSVEINATTNSNKATITSGVGNISLNSNSTTTKVKVKAEDGTTKSYTIKITKSTSAINTLSSLSVEGYSLDKTFDKDILEYELTEELDFSVDELNINYTKANKNETVEVVGNTNLIAGETNDIKVVVTASNGDKRTYTIKATRKENLNYYNISSTRTIYEVGYRYNNDDLDLIEDTIIVNSNILDGDITADTSESGKLILKDNYGSTIELDSDMDLSYIEDSDTNSHAIKVNYENALDVNNSTSKTIKVSGYRKGTQIGITYDINFNIKRIYYVTLDVSGLDEDNKGFYYEDESVYNLTFYAGEELVLSDYSEAYKRTADNKCMVYELESYNTEKDGNGNPNYFNETIQVNEDLVLYGVYDESTPVTYILTDKRLYLSDIDLFETEKGDKVISPGTKGSYVMHIKNTSKNVIKLRKLYLEENEVCVDNKCLNMGYIAKQIDVNSSVDNYLIGGSNSNYETIRDTHSKDVDIKDSTDNYIKIMPDKEVEITILWKWLDDDENDTKIGNYAASLNDDLYYYLTISYSYDIESEECQG